jgi:hypothetical protein
LCSELGEFEQGMIHQAEVAECAGNQIQTVDLQSTTHLFALMNHGTMW